MSKNQEDAITALPPAIDRARLKVDIPFYEDQTPCFTVSSLKKRKCLLLVENIIMLNKIRQINGYPIS